MTDTKNRKAQATLALEAALDQDDLETVEKAVDVLLSTMTFDEVTGPESLAIKALGRFARRAQIRKNAAQARRDEIRPFDPPVPGDNLALLAQTEPPDAVRDAVRESYYDAARIVLEPRAGVARYLAKAMADRLVARAHGLAQPGAGAFPHERAFRVYRTDHTGVSTAVPSAPLLGRGGLLTLEEAMKLRAATPESWIGVSPSHAPHSILPMEG